MMVVMGLKRRETGLGRLFDLLKIIIFNFKYYFIL